VLYQLSYLAAAVDQCSPALERKLADFARAIFAKSAFFLPNGS
jgi:hypothetical protein